MNKFFTILVIFLIPVIIMAFCFDLVNRLFASVADTFSHEMTMEYKYSDGVIWIHDKKDYVLCDDELNIIFKLSDKHEGYVPETNFYNGASVISNDETGKVRTINKSGESIPFNYSDCDPSIENWVQGDVIFDDYWRYAWMLGYNDITNYDSTP